MNGSINNRWGNLSLKEKNTLLGIYASKGYTDLASIIAHYNSFASGGRLTLQQWKSKMQSKYPDIEMDNYKAGYDYDSYFNDNYDAAVRQLSDLQHFPDTYKLPNHRTFSNESMYSRGPMIGGQWTNAPISNKSPFTTERFTPSNVNRQYYSDIYKENRPYSEGEIYHSFAPGGFIQSPDWDPEHKHIHTQDGKKMILDESTGNINDPLNKDVLEQTKLEELSNIHYSDMDNDEYKYEKNPEYDKAIEILRSRAYGPQRALAVNYWDVQGQKYGPTPLPQGYSRDEYGVITDSEGRYYTPYREVVNGKPNAVRRGDLNNGFYNKERNSFGYDYDQFYERVELPSKYLYDKPIKPKPADYILSYSDKPETWYYTQPLVYSYKKRTNKGVDLVKDTYQYFDHETGTLQTHKAGNPAPSLTSFIRSKIPYNTALPLYKQYKELEEAGYGDLISKGSGKLPVGLTLTDINNHNVSAWTRTMDNLYFTGYEFRHPDKADKVRNASLEKGVLVPEFNLLNKLNGFDNSHAQGGHLFGPGGNFGHITWGGPVGIDSSLAGSAATAPKPMREIARNYNEEIARSRGNSYTGNKGDEVRRKLLNDTPTAQQSQDLEDAMHKAIYNSVEYNSPKYDYTIPYIYDKEIKINGHRTSENVLDTLYKYSQETGLPFVDALGLAGQETGYGSMPVLNIMPENLGLDLDTGLTAKEENRILANTNYFRNYGSIPANNLVRDFAWENTDMSQHPLIHAFNYFKAGKYNTGDPNHTSDVRRTGQKALESKAVKEWAKRKGITFDKGGHLFSPGGYLDEPQNGYYTYQGIDGKTIGISSDLYNKYKDDPLFKNKLKGLTFVENTETENPEYNLWLKTLNRLYASTNNNPAYYYPNYRNFGNRLPQGYSINENGIVFDSNGVPYVQGTFLRANGQYEQDGQPVTFNFNEGKPIERNVTYYPLGNIPSKTIMPRPPMDYEITEDILNNSILNNPTYQPDSAVLRSVSTEQTTIPSEQNLNKTGRVSGHVPPFRNYSLRDIRNDYTQFLGTDLDVTPFFPTRITEFDQHTYKPALVYANYDKMLQDATLLNAPREVIRQIKDASQNYDNYIKEIYPYASQFYTIKHKNHDYGDRFSILKQSLGRGHNPIDPNWKLLTEEERLKYSSKIKDLKLVDIYNKGNLLIENNKISEAWDYYNNVYLPAVKSYANFYKKENRKLADTVTGITEKYKSLLPTTFEWFENLPQETKDKVKQQGDYTGYSGDKYFPGYFNFGDNIYYSKGGKLNEPDNLPSPLYYLAKHAQYPKSNIPFTDVDDKTWMKWWYENRQKQLKDNYDEYYLQNDDSAEYSNFDKYDINRAIDFANLWPIQFTRKKDWPKGVEGETDPNSSTIYLDPSAKRLHSNRLHEKIHAFSYELAKGKHYPYVEPSFDPYTNSIGEVSNLPYNPILNAISPTGFFNPDKDRYPNSYWDNTNEVYSRLMEMRRALKLLPTDTQTKEDIDKWRKDGTLERYGLHMYNDSDLLYLFNNVAQNNTKNLSHHAALGGHLHQNGSYLDEPDNPPIKAYDIPTLQPIISVADNTQYKVSPTPQEIEESRKAYEAAQIREALAKRTTPVLKADTRTKAEIDMIAKQRQQAEYNRSINEAVSSTMSVGRPNTESSQATVLAMPYVIEAAKNYDPTNEIKNAMYLMPGISNVMMAQDARTAFDNGQTGAGVINAAFALAPMLGVTPNFKSPLRYTRPANRVGDWTILDYGRNTTTTPIQSSTTPMFSMPNTLRLSSVERPSLSTRPTQGRIGTTNRLQLPEMTESFRALEEAAYQQHLEDLYNNAGGLNADELFEELEALRARELVGPNPEPEKLGNLIPSTLNIRPQIKPLIKGAEIEKQLSKTGTISRKSLDAYIAKQGKYYQDVMNETLESEFKGVDKIDYVAFQDAVQKRLPEYSRISQTLYQDYGFDNLGFRTRNGDSLTEAEILQHAHNDELKALKQIDEDFDRGNINSNTRLLLRKRIRDSIAQRLSIKLNTFTFETPGIAGNTLHYRGNPIGHSRTYTTTTEPEILHVMESQSDWAQHPTEAHNIEKLKQREARQRASIEELETALKDNKFPNGMTIEYDYQRDMINEDIARYKQDLDETLRYLDQAKRPTLYKQMIDTYTERQIQENLRYAAEQGQTKMRYPTRETAAKIEGYSGTPYGEYYDVKKELDEVNGTLYGMTHLPEPPRDITGRNTGEELSEATRVRQRIAEIMESDMYKQTAKKAAELRKKLREVQDKKYIKYSPQHETILKKYDAFPKQFQKLFGKKAEVRTVTDSKGNTWYEVNVPESYKDETGQIIFATGGLLSLGTANNSSSID